MISHLNGTLEQTDKNHLVIDVNGVGYQVNVPASVLAALPAVGAKIKIFTVQVVRENDISLYGFLNKEDRALFNQLLSVSGIGPKSAMTIIAAFPLERLVAAIAQGDVGLLSSVSGVGKKTAERIVLELKEKISKTYAIKPSDVAAGVKGDQAVISDSIAAMISLGYSPREAREAILKLDTENLDSVEAVIKLALKNLN